MLIIKCSFVKIYSVSVSSKKYIKSTFFKSGAFIQLTSFKNKVEIRKYTFLLPHTFLVHVIDKYNMHKKYSLELWWNLQSHSLTNLGKEFHVWEHLAFHS